MKLDTRPPQHLTRPAGTVRASAPVRPSPRSRRLLLALALVVAAGFLLGLGLPAHP